MRFARACADFVGLLLLGAGHLAAASTAVSPQRNAIIFVADGLKHDAVNATDAPTMFKLRQRGVDFVNSHALFPTFTTPNASGIATGHYLGDTGDFSNYVYAGFPIFNDGVIAGKKTGTQTPFLENNLVLADVDEHFSSGNYLNEQSLLARARQQGFSTAAIGKLGPVGIQDVTQLKLVGGLLPTPATVFIDDDTGSAAGIPLAASLRAALSAASLDLKPPVRSQAAGNVATPGTLVANRVQQQYFADVATKVVLPSFKASGKPFVLVFWSRDPDGTQHNQGDSLNRLVPGINGPTSKAGIANADANLKQILDYLDSNATLRDSTDVFVTADHGFATISKHEVDAAGRGTMSYAATFTYADANGHPEVISGWLPPGFLALDLAHALALPLFDPDAQLTIDGTAHYKPVDPAQPATPTHSQRPVAGSGLIGGSGVVQNVTDAQVIVAANGGSDLIYVPDRSAERVQKIVTFLNQQDYVGGLFVDSSLGAFPGALSLADISLEGGALMPRPAIVVAFKTFATDVQRPYLTAVMVADTPLQEGQGMHGSFGRDNTFNNMIATGPDFKRGYRDSAPVGNADIVPTLARALGLTLTPTGELQGRILEEALRGGPAVVASKRQLKTSTADATTHRVTALDYQSVGSRHYFDSACVIDGTTKLNPKQRKPICRP